MLFIAFLSILSQPKSEFSEKARSPELFRAILSRKPPVNKNIQYHHLAKEKASKPQKSPKKQYKYKKTAQNSAKQTF